MLEAIAELLEVMTIFLAALSLIMVCVCSFTVNKTYYSETFYKIYKTARDFASITGFTTVCVGTIALFAFLLMAL